MKHNSNSMRRVAFTSPPTPKKKTMSPPRTRNCRPPRPQSTTEQTREKTPIIRSRAKLRLSMLIKPSFEGKPLTDPSPGTIPRICSPFPALAASCPPPFKFACFYFHKLSCTFVNTLNLVSSSQLSTRWRRKEDGLAPHANTRALEVLASRHQRKLIMTRYDFTF